MKKKRVIPVLLLKDGVLVQSNDFVRYRSLGNPVAAVKRLSEWAADELIYLDISSEEKYDQGRDDIKHPNRHSILDIIEDVSKATFMPITVGGRIRTLTDIELRLKKGADKISINSKPLEDPSFIQHAAREFGSQCIVISMDVKKIDLGHLVFSSGGKKNTGYGPVEWAKIAENEGAGELLINCIDRDGTKSGFEIDLIRSVSDAVKIPVIALGGAGEWEHFAEVFRNTKADAVAAANLFQHTDQSVFLAKKYLYDNNFPVRKPTLIKIE